MAGYVPKQTYVSAAEKAARAELDDLASIHGGTLELEREVIDTWFRAYKTPSPTLFALDFGIDPALLKEEAARNDMVRLALYRMIAQAESALFSAVYGPKAVIQRVELFLPIQTVDEAETLGTDSMFVDAV